MGTRNRLIAVGVLACLLALGFASAASALALGDVLKVAGIGWLVTRYGDQIDTFITRSLGEHEAAARGATKVVPILSVGRGAYIGAAQVVGNPENVRQVKAVFQVEGRIGSFRPRILVPTISDRVTGNPERAKGVGVSAVIEFTI